MFTNPEFLTVPGTSTGEPPDDSGLWMELIADTFGAAGARQLWTRPNPLSGSSLPPSDAPLPRRLSFDLCPPLDLEAARDREVLVAEDAWNGSALLVIPAAVARIDAAYIAAISESCTVGELQRNPRAWNTAADRHDSQRDGEYEPLAAALDDATPYDPAEWFGDDGIINVMPLARLRTAQAAPAAIDSLAQEDHSFGLDYEPAPWWDSADEGEIITSLEVAGYRVVRDEVLAGRYSSY